LFLETKLDRKKDLSVEREGKKKAAEII